MTDASIRVVGARSLYRSPLYHLVVEGRPACGSKDLGEPSRQTVSQWLTTHIFRCGRCYRTKVAAALLAADREARAARKAVQS